MVKIVFKIIIPTLFIFISCSFIGSTEEKINIIKGSSTYSGESFSLVQLFTSQGCSSCPSADRLLEEVKIDYSNDNVYVLSYHVDYWNRLGWSDPFSKKEFTAKQYEYGSKFGVGRVYTPQAVINGSLHFVGSSESKMKTNLSRFLNSKAENTIAFSEIKKEDGFIKFNYSVDGTVADKNLKLALVINQRLTSVKRGENRGKSISNSNIVIEEIVLSLDNLISTAQIAIPEIVNSKDELSVIGYIQDEKLKISGASSAKI